MKFLSVFLPAIFLLAAGVSSTEATAKAGQAPKSGVAASGQAKIKKADQARPPKPSYVQREREAKAKLIRILSKTYRRSDLETIFRDQRLVLDKTVVGIFPPKEEDEEEEKEEPPVDYFDEKYELLSVASFERGLEYYSKNKEIFKKAKEKYGVESEAILGIMRVETYFGRLIGERSVINTLYSIYVLSPHRRNWALRELTFFLKLYKPGQQDIFEIKGSIAGALGIPQFMPSSFWDFAEDGDGDGQINLFSDADAIISAANYLEEHGWNEKYRDRRKAVRAYNHENAYVIAVLVYAQAFKTFRILRSSVASSP